MGRPLLNYWSFNAAEEQIEQTGFANQVAWLGHVVTHFISDTRWRRTFHVIR
jgi:signal peptidase I